MGKNKLMLFGYDWLDEKQVKSLQNRLKICILINFSFIGYCIYVYAKG